MIILGFLITGLVTGYLAGLLGIGGGVVIVPALMFLLHFAGVPTSAIVHTAVATSLACMLLTTLGPIISHWRHGNLDWSVYKKFIGGIIVGVIIGVLVSSFIPGKTLKLIFGVFLVLAAIKLAWPSKTESNEHRLPNLGLLNFITFIFGVLAPILGIGGGIMLVPYLESRGIHMVKASALSSASSFVIALLGTITWMMVGHLGLAYMPANLNLIDWRAVLIIGICSIISSGWGVKAAMKVHTTWLKRGFALLLVITAIKIFY